MNLNKTQIWLTFSLVILNASVIAQSSVVAQGSVPVLVSSEYLFTEGPAVDAGGNIYFTDQPNDKIMKWSTDGSVSVFMEGTGRSNGLFVDKNGNLIACADLNNQLWMIDKSKNVTVLVKDFEGKKIEWS